MQSVKHRELSEEICTFLDLCGFSRSTIRRCNYSTRLLHDLHRYGSDALECMSTLQTRFGVNMESFRFDRYFPEERPRIRNLKEAICYPLMLVGLLPFERWLAASAARFVPMPPRLVEQAIRDRKWPMHDESLSASPDASGARVAPHSR